jgi:MinD-like ATPase involved in chromosome partitioning or flagellar assembly
MQQKSRSHAGFKATLVIAVVSMVGTTAAIVYFPWLLTSRKNVDSVIQQVNESITRGTSREVVRIFNNVQATLEITEKVFGNQLIDLNNAQSRESFFLNLLATQPNFTWIEFGFANGNYFGVQRVKDEKGEKTVTLNLINRIWNAQQKKTAKTIIPHEQLGDRFLPKQKIQQVETYDASQRGWYKSATQNPDKIAWTDVYIFRTSKTPGISASIPVVKAGKVLGVTSIAFELKQISDYLRRLQDKQREGAIFLVNENNQLVASTTFSEAPLVADNRAETDVPKLQQLEDVDNPYLKLVNQTFQTYQLSVRDIVTDTKIQTQYIYRDPSTSDRYYISLTPLQYPESFKAQNANYPKWVVGTVIPESYYVAEIDKNKRRLFYIIAGFLVSAVGLAIFIADRIFVQPILTIAKAAEAIESEEFETVDLGTVTKRQDELGHLATIFETMTRQVYSREKELKEQLQALKIEIDQSKLNKNVQEIVSSDFFQKLNEKAALSVQPNHHSPTHSSPQTKIISVHSHRGGTGKSNLTANIAATIAQYGYRVGILDTDLSSPGIHVLFGFQDDDIQLSLNDYLWGRCEIEQAAYDVTALLKKPKTDKSQLYLIPVSSKQGEISKILREGYDVDVLQKGIERLRNTLALDYLLLDTHSGINEETLLSMTLSDLLIIVLRTDQQDFQGTAVTVDIARKLHISQLMGIINQAPIAVDFEQLQQKVEETYDIDVAGILGHSDEMMLLGSKELFVIDYPSDPLTQKIEQIVKKIVTF